MWSSLILPGVPLVVFAFSCWRDPRKMRTAVYFLTVIVACAMLAAFAVIAAAARLDNGTALTWLILVGAALVVLLVVVLGIALVLNGLTMVRKEGRRLANLLSLMLGLAILAYVGLGITVIASNSSDLFVWVFVLGLPVGYLAYGFLSYLWYGAAYLWFTRHFGKAVDAIIVLGAGLVRGRVAPLLASRLDGAHSLLERPKQADQHAIVIVSGGRGADEPRSEADAMADYLTKEGVPGDIIVREDASTTTEENLRFSAKVLAQRGIAGPVAVVTNNFHAFRAALDMRQAKIPGYSIGTRTAGYYRPSATIREYAAILRDHLVVNILGVGTTSIPLILMLVNLAA
jgi:uncharacterized SAM-binding protein YcdF (DUF218 family)